MVRDSWQRIPQPAAGEAPEELAARLGVGHDQRLRRMGLAHVLRRDESCPWPGADAWTHRARRPGASQWEVWTRTTVCRPR